MASSGPSCTICYESYVDSTNMCSTKCGHIFHMTCLQQWITQSNTCPMCCENNPQPHRIYLDISVINESKVSNPPPEENDENTVVLKGLKPSQITTPLNSLIQKLIVIMQLPIRDIDIKDTKKLGHKRVSLQVTFKTKRHMDLFLTQKHKLKNNPETSEIRIYELLNAETEALFQYTHKLKNADYNIVFVKNKQVYVKKNKNSQPIHILTKGQVDALCLPHTPQQKMTQSKNEVRSTNREIGSTTMAQRNNEIHATNREITSMVQRNNELRSQILAMELERENRIYYARNNPIRNHENNDNCIIL